MTRSVCGWFHASASTDRCRSPGSPPAPGSTVKLSRKQIGCATSEGRFAARSTDSVENVDGGQFDAQLR
jgi:hypothetical protein